MRIEGSVGLVTGGGSGLGAAVATMLARGGGLASRAGGYLACGLVPADGGLGGIGPL